MKLRRTSVCQIHAFRELHALTRLEELGLLSTGCISVEYLTDSETKANNLSIFTWRADTQFKNVLRPRLDNY